MDECLRDLERAAARGDPVHEALNVARLRAGYPVCFCGRAATKEMVLAEVSTPVRLCSEACAGRVSALGNELNRRTRERTGHRVPQGAEYEFFFDERTRCRALRASWSSYIMIDGQAYHGPVYACEAIEAPMFDRQTWPRASLADQPQ